MFCLNTSKIWIMLNLLKWKRNQRRRNKILNNFCFSNRRISLRFHWIVFSDLNSSWVKENPNENLHQNKNVSSHFPRHFHVHSVHMIDHVKWKCKRSFSQSILQWSNSRDRKANIGTIHCQMCQETYSTSIHCKLFCSRKSISMFFFVDLSEAVDVYNSWIDACEEQNREWWVIAREEHPFLLHINVNL